jgi:hypothetical protein
MIRIRQRAWDFGLTVLTMVLFGTIGVQSFIGTLYTWWAQRTVPNWEQTGYNGFVQLMNAIAAPQIVLLVVVMGLCVPKRLFVRRGLVAVSALMLVAGLGVGAWTKSLATGMGVYLVLAALIQVAVVVLTIAGAGGLSYLTEGRFVKTGSGLLHLGFIVFCIIVVNLQRSPYMMPVFWFSAVTVLLGTVMSFYASRLAPYSSARAAMPPMPGDDEPADEETEYEPAADELSAEALPGEASALDADAEPLPDSAPEPESGPGTDSA